MANLQNTLGCRPGFPSPGGRGGITETSGGSPRLTHPTLQWHPPPLRYVFSLVKVTQIKALCLSSSAIRPTAFVDPLGQSAARTAKPTNGNLNRPTNCDCIYESRSKRCIFLQGATCKYKWQAAYTLPLKLRASGRLGMVEGGKPLATRGPDSKGKQL
jgi:hypothetical protein